MSRSLLLKIVLATTANCANCEVSRERTFNYSQNSPRGERFDHRPSLTLRQSVQIGAFFFLLTLTRVAFASRLRTSRTCRRLISLLCPDQITGNTQSIALPRLNWVTYYVAAEWLAMLVKLRQQLKTLLFLVRRQQLSNFAMAAGRLYPLAQRGLRRSESWS
ncbi:hypothetical protein DM02DRAFT_311633 [Periconia macrospinosa]|uniref:Secreted protein n=1 Tax=Periconia macrospinosa TaxID=97972 RepID=A0A2V1D1F5_9PLEO|nr:hypothetical protein DM02DRAFT_311633 [Periconia macrospinosa]